ncbi:MAG: MoaD/ThiS family protein [Chloroflexi bacterium]|nr:MoaD/ThiS family protein [Chloroflexota bacterium]
MGVRIRIPYSLVHLTGGQSAVEVFGDNVGECLDSLQARFPELKATLFNEEGKLRALFDVYVNHQSTYPEGLLHPVKGGDELLLIMIIGGG